MPRERKRKDKRGALNLLAQSIYIIMLVIILVILFIMMYSSKEQQFKQQLNNQNAIYAGELLSSILLRQECFAVGTGSVTETPLRNHVKYLKIAASTGKNRDLHCLPYFNGIARLTFRDLELATIHNVTIEDLDPSWAEETFTQTSPVAIDYSGVDTRVGVAKIELYTGKIPSFYNAVKFASYAKEGGRFPLTLNKPVHYQNASNRFCIGEDYTDCFYAQFYSLVADFRLEKGEHIVQVQVINDTVRVRV